MKKDLKRSVEVYIVNLDPRPKMCATKCDLLTTPLLISLDVDDSYLYNLNRNSYLIR